MAGHPALHPGLADGDGPRPCRHRAGAGAHGLRGGGGAQVIGLPECSSRSISARRRTRIFSTWRSPSRIRISRPSRSWLPRSGSPSWCPSSRRAPGSTTTAPPSSTRTGASLAKLKMHIPRRPGFTTRFYFAPGDLGFKAVDTAYGRIGTLICWDQWHPRARAHGTARRDAALLPDRHRLAPGREGAVRRGATRRVVHGAACHAIANGVYLAAANRWLRAAGAGAGGHRVLGTSSSAIRRVIRAGRDRPKGCSSP